MNKDKVHVSIRHINKVYDDGTKALQDINLDVYEGEILVLLGSSGCGKSTLLRTIGGLEKKTSGEIYFYDEEITDVPVEKRQIGFVFQNYALFPTMTVRQNIAFGLKLKKLPKEEINKQVDALIKMMNLEPYADKKPANLSGGQQQRVAIARVLAIRPKVLLMDEPLTALDAKLKEYLRVELGHLLRQLNITTIYVTHDQLEAMALADRIAIMNKGVIEQVDEPAKIYSEPKTNFVAQFIGKINQFRGKYTDDGQVDLGFQKIPYSGSVPHKAGDEMNIYIRLEDMSIATDIQPDDFIIEAKVSQTTFMGGYCQIEAMAGDHELYFETPNQIHLSKDDPVRIKVDKEKIIII